MVIKVLLKLQFLVGFEVLTVVGMKSSIFRDMSYSALKINQIFWRNISPPPEGPKTKPSNKPTQRRQQVELATWGYIA
jgi:hypothetical protein